MFFGSYRKTKQVRASRSILLSIAAGSPVCSEFHAESTNCERDGIYISGADNFVISSQNEL